MDSFEWNKVFGAVLATVLFIVGLNILVGKSMAPHQSGKPGMAVEVTETPTSGGPAVAEVAPDWGTVLPAADVAAGEKVAAKCASCHDFAKDGPAKIGPALFGVVGRNHASNAAYASAPGYSPAMKALADKPWGYDDLNDFIKSPKAAVPGTKMAFAGISKTQDRVNLIAYLRSLSDSPMAIPAPNPVAPPAAPAEAPAGEATPPGATPPAGAPAAGAPAAPEGTAAPAAPAAGATPAPTAPATPAPAQPAGGGH
jgi:cytochrome c